ncbi:MAG: hypothetical protein Kow0029_23290 [Candidatus Rifleibacteriota bacterium]
MGNFAEAEEIFSTFIKTWPEHKLIEKAKYLRTLSQAKTLDYKVETYRKSLIDNLKAAENELSPDYKAKDKLEIYLTINESFNYQSHQRWDEMKQMSDEALLTLLRRGWFPDPALNPIKTLEFVNYRESMCKKNTIAELKARLGLIKATALWQIFLSPLSLSANARILKTWGDWPVHNALIKALNDGFNFGNVDIKKKVALIGYHYDYFRDKDSCANNKPSDLKSRWFTYLSERGINLQEAWCPR